MPGRKTVTIKGQFGSEEFAANYRAAVEGEKSVKRFAGKHGTFNRLASEYLNSATFAELAPDTQRTRRYITERFLGRFGTYPVATLERRHVEKIIAGEKSGQKKIVLSMLRALIALAITNGDRKDDPTSGIKIKRPKGDGWHTWSEEELLQFEARHPVGSPARLVFALALYTGQRAADLVPMGRQHVRDGKIHIVQKKTKKALAIPIHPNLQAIIDATPSGHLTFIVSDWGKPFASAQSLSFRVRTWVREAGLKGCPLHGLRKASCRRLAEAGCTVHQIAAISGHKSILEVQRYTSAVDQTKLAEEAMAKTLPRTDTVQITTHTRPRTTHRRKKA